MILETTSPKWVLLVSTASAATLVGVWETFVAQSSILGPVSMTAGSIILILAWLARRIAKVAEGFVEGQGRKLIDLPTKAQLDQDRVTLISKLETFAERFDEERAETGKFRMDLVRTLENHTVRLENLERKL